jgi:cytochrome-b5 reductase
MGSNKMVWLYILLLAGLLYLFVSRKKVVKVQGKCSAVPIGPLQGEENFLPFTLVRKTEDSHDTKTFRFQLKPGQSLGLPIGQHVIIKETIPSIRTPEGEVVIRKYTPVSSLADQGHFDLLVKVYQPTPNFPDSGLMSRWLDSLPLNSTVPMSGPKGGLIYQGGGLFQISQGKEATVQRVRRLGMVAGGTGIAPCYQIMQYIASHPDEKLEMSLIYGSRTEDDILLKQSIDYFARTTTLKVYYIVDTAPPNWTGGSGFITQEMMEAHLPPPGDDVLIVHCGPPPMNVSVRKHLVAIGHRAQAIFKF